MKPCARLRAMPRCISIVYRKKIRFLVLIHEQYQFFLALTGKLSVEGLIKSDSVQHFRIPTSLYGAMKLIRRDASGVPF